MAEEARAAPVVSIAQRAGYGTGLGAFGAVALVVAGFIGLVLALVLWAFGADQSWEVVPSIMLGSALWMALEIRDLRRVESHA